MLTVGRCTANRNIFKDGLIRISSTFSSEYPLLGLRLQTDVIIFFPCQVFLSICNIMNWEHSTYLMLGAPAGNNIDLRSWKGIVLHRNRFGIKKL